MNNKVVIFYPWGIDSIIQKSNGAGLRVALLAEFLNSEGYAVRVVSAGLKGKIVATSEIVFEQIQFPSSLFLAILYVGAMGLARAVSIPAIKAWLYFSFHTLDRSFAQKLQGIADDCRHVFLEYPFWSSIFPPYRVILTDYDIIAESWTCAGGSSIGCYLRSKLLDLELTALRGCRHAVVVSDNDKVFFKKLGIGNISTIVNPVNSLDIIQKTAEQKAVADYAVPPVAIFIGSGWYPNRDAARNIIQKVAPHCNRIKFIIAGDCSTSLKCDAPNVTCLGRITPQELERLYEKATFALVPLAWGTGSSLKTLEAMAYGKVLVSTHVGVRGIDFDHDIHGIISDDIEQYADILNVLYSDPKRRAQLASNARELAARYDYRYIFRKYINIIQQQFES